MTTATWVDGVDGHLEVTVEAAPTVLLHTAEDVATYVQTHGDSLDDSVLAFLGQCFAVMCFAVHMRRVNDPVHMKGQLERIMDDVQPYLGVPEKNRAFDSGSSRVLDTIRSNIDSDFSTLLRIMVDELARAPR